MPAPAMQTVPIYHGAEQKAFVIPKLALHRLRYVIIAFTLALVATDFLVLSCTLLHQRLQLSIVVFCDSLGRHLNFAMTTSSLDILPDILNGLLQYSNTQVFFQARASEDIERWRYKFDLDLVIWRISGLCGPQCSLDRINALITEASNFDIRTNFCRLWSETLSNVGL